MLLNNTYPAPDMNPGYVPVKHSPEITRRYHVVVKRHDFMYRMMDQAHVFISVVGVLAVIGMFLGVIYGVLQLSNVFETVYAIRTQQVP